MSAVGSAELELRSPLLTVAAGVLGVCMQRKL